VAKNSTTGELWKDVQRTVLEAAARLTPESRQRAAAGHADGPAAEYVARIRDRAFATTDEHIQELRAAGLDDDTIYELTIAAAIGAAEMRRARGFAAIAAAAVAAKKQEVA
jgi:hypothetical protein